MGNEMGMPEPEENPPIFKAAAKGKVEKVLQLLKNGSKVDERGETYATPLHVACLSGFADVCSVLIEHGADLEARSKTQETPLHLAATYCNYDCCKVLLDSGANPRAVDWRGKTPLECCKTAFLRTEDKPRCLRLLQEAFSQPNILQTKAEDLQKQAQLAMDNEDFSQAESLLTKAIESNESDYLLYSLRATCHFELGQALKSKMDCLKCVGLNRKYVKGHAQLALANVLLGDIWRAEECVNTALELSPNDKFALDVQKSIQEIRETPEFKKQQVSKDFMLTVTNEENVTKEIILTNVSDFKTFKQRICQEFYPDGTRKIRSITRKPEGTAIANDDDLNSLERELVLSFMVTFKPIRKCNTCQTKEGKLLLCKRCEFVYYCGKECQTKDWSEHKKTCKPKKSQ